MKKHTKKKQSVVKAPSKNIRHEIVVKVQPVTATAEDLKPIEEGGKYMIPKTWISERQVIRLVQRTPQQHIYHRPAKGGGTWAYVTGNYVEKVLNFTFGWNWDFEVVAHGREGDQVWVHGKLRVKDHTGTKEIVKSQFGRADVKFKRDGKGMLDFGNDLKAATTDALKKCASLLGIASDIYGKTEYKEETGRDVPNKPTLPNPSDIKLPEDKPEETRQLAKGQILGPDGEPTWVCQECGDPISDEAHTFSKKMFGKSLCREHQEEANNKRKK